MSAQSYEKYIADTPVTTLQLVPDLIEDELHNSLQAYLGASPRLLSYDATLVKDYVGPANNKKQVGGRMIVHLTLDTPGQEQIKVVVDENERPFSENTICELGKIANRNFLKGKGVYNDVFLV